MSNRMLKVLVLVAFVALSLRSVAGQMTQKDPAIGGYCPVAYVAVGKALKGDRKYASDHDGKHYLFVNADAKKMFDDNPAKFAIGYDSWCATAIAHGKKLASDPALFTVHNGVTYLFSSADAKAAFDRDKAGHVKKADEQWKRMR